MSDNIDIADFEQRVRIRAYWLWEGEGRPDGRHVEHWLLSEAAERAESEAAPAEVVMPAQVEAAIAAPASAAIIETPKAAAPKKPAAKAKTARASKKPLAAAKRSAPVHEISAGL